jgi:cytoskeletal protein RodZ
LSPKFVKTAVRKSEALGEKLSKKRVSLGFEIKDVERSIRIRAKHVEYIENGEWEKLPPDVYVRGFLRTYARFLRLDPEKVIILYLKEKGLTENVKKITTKTELPKSKFKTPKLIVTPKRLIILGTALVGAILITYIGWQITILTAPPKLNLSTPNDNIRVEDDAVIVEGKTDAGANVFVNDVPIGVSPDGYFKESVSLQEGVNLIKISAKNRLEKKTEVTRTIVAKLPTISPVGATKDELAMKITIGPKAASLLIKLDGKALTEKETLMLSGATQTLRASNSITISTSNGGSVRVELNGEDLGLLGEDGERVDNKEFTRESI